MPETPALDPNARQGLLRKIRDGEFADADVPAYLALFCETANKDGDIQNEVRGWDRRIHLALSGQARPGHAGDDGPPDAPVWVVVTAGRFSSGTGSPEGAELVLRMSTSEAARILVGDKDAKASYLAGTLKVEGALPDAVRFQTLVGLVIDALEL